MSETPTSLLTTFMLVVCGTVIAVWGQPLPSLAAALVIIAVAGLAGRDGRQGRPPSPVASRARRRGRRATSSGG